MITIRQAQKQDSLSVVNLIYLAIKDIAFQLTGTTSENIMKEKLEAYFLLDNNRFSSRLVHVLVNENGIAAMILCYHGKAADQLYKPIRDDLKDKHNNDTITIDNEADEEDFYIDAIAVFPEEQGKGYAKQLFMYAERYAIEKGWSTISLNVDVDNIKAKTIYENMGYRPVKHIIINEHPYLYMVKKLVE